MLRRANCWHGKFVGEKISVDRAFLGAGKTLDAFRLVVNLFVGKIDGPSWAVGCTNIAVNATLSVSA